MAGEPVRQVGPQLGVRGCVRAGQGFASEQGIGVADVEHRQEAVLKLIRPKIQDGVAETALRAFLGIVVTENVTVFAMELMIL